ncbi:MAG: helix-hairpin-helix domain-containing protein [Candidatus Marinimicrobia bacterium]|nr:helix-hairpin-helix domain-containing protein [Candidatus Neomarinimicrobiota bacterium]
MKIFTTQERTVVIILASLFMLGMAVKAAKEHFDTSMDQVTLIGSNADVVDFYAGLNEEDIESAGKVDINTAEIEELKSLPGVGEKTAEKIINKRNELGAFSVLEDLMLVPGIGKKTFEKLLPYIQIQ